MRFSKHRFTIDADYDENLLYKVEKFRKETSTKKAVHIALITTIGLTQNECYDDVQNVIEMNQLFKI